MNNEVTSVDKIERAAQALGDSHKTLSFEPNDETLPRKLGGPFGGPGKWYWSDHTEEWFVGGDVFRSEPFPNYWECLQDAVKPENNPHWA